jgi:glycosyltransferase involved in cell wall biosynthesis
MNKDKCLPPTISIIVQVYNDEANLNRCIDSILSQTCENFECLVIDDGSTDSCPALCDEYAKKDSRIRVFHKKNEGISKTRQFGINHADGDYIFFVDSDDWIKSTSVADILQEINNTQTDILFFDFFEEISPGKERYHSQNPHALDSEIVIRMVLEGRIFSCLWNIIINRNFYVNSNVIFKSGINYGEDTLFVMELLLKKPRISYLAGAYYYHTQNDASFTRIKERKIYLHRIDFLNHIPILLDEYNRNDLVQYNFFPLNDKYEILKSGLLSKKEYHTFFPPSFSFYFLRQSGLLKFLLLFMAETNFYYPVKYLAVLLKRIKRSIR